MTIAYHTVANPDIVETVPGDGQTGYILDDRDPEDPRTWGNAGRMLCWHNRHTLGDTHEYGGPGDWLNDVLSDTPLPDDAARGLLLQAIRTPPHPSMPWASWRTDYREHLGNMDAGQYEYPITDKRNWFIAEHLSTDEDTHHDIIAALNEDGHVILPLYLYDHSGLSMSTGAFSCRWDSSQVGWAHLTPDEIAAEFGGDRDRAAKYLTGQVEEYDQYLTGDIYGYVIEDSDGEELHACGGFYGIEAARDELTAMMA